VPSSIVPSTSRTSPSSRGPGRRPFKAKTPEDQFKDKRICVTGTIEEFRGTPEIVVTAPAQIVGATATKRD